MTQNIEAFFRKDNTERRSQDTSLSRSKKRATAGHRQGDGKRALAKQSIIRETFERERAMGSARLFL